MSRSPNLNSMKNKIIDYLKSRGEAENEKLLKLNSFEKSNVKQIEINREQEKMLLRDRITQLKSHINSINQII